MAPDPSHAACSKVQISQIDGTFYSIADKAFDPSLMTNSVLIASAIFGATPGDVIMTEPYCERECTYGLSILEGGSSVERKGQ